MLGALEAVAEKTFPQETSPASVVRFIRHDGMRQARLIAVSGYGQQKDRARSLSAGFDLHLVKPVDPARLTEAINNSATA